MWYVYIIYIPIIPIQLHLQYLHPKIIFDKRIQIFIIYYVSHSPCPIILYNISVLYNIITSNNMQVYSFIYYVGYSKFCEVYLKYLPKS